MILAKVKPVEFSGRRPRLGKPSSLGRLRRQVSIIGPERTFRRAIATDYRTFGRELLAALRESGVFERLAQDAARYMDSQDATRRREGAKQEDPEPIGRGGVPLSPGHRRELRRVFSRGAIGFAADLVEDQIDAFRLSFASTLDENYHDLFDVGGRAARLSLGVSGSFNLRSPAIAEALDQRANLLSGSIADDVFDRMITVIAQEFYLEGKGPLEVARSLEDEFDWLERDRAERIARTETLGVTEEAQWMTYGVSGVEWKRWMTTLDGRERETHFEAHGQIKALDEPFEVGADELMFPGDPEGSPGEICNCRCASQAIVHESQVFNDRAVWDGENDPDEFSRERVLERQDQEFNERLGEFEGEKRVPMLRRFFGSWFKAEREYERDDLGRFASTGGESLMSDERTSSETASDRGAAAVEAGVEAFDRELRRVGSGDEVGGLRVMEGPVANTDSIDASFNDPIVLPGIREFPMNLLGPKPTSQPRLSERNQRLRDQIRESREIAPLIVAIDRRNGPYILEGAHRIDVLESLNANSFPALIVFDNDDGDFEREKRAKQERDYVRDEVGRFSETEGGGGSTEETEGGSSGGILNGETGGQPLDSIPEPATRSIRTAEARIQDQKFETGFAVDADGNVLVEKNGGRDSVSFTPDEAGRMRGAFFTHNHPGGRTFSSDDIVMASTLGMAEMRATGPGGVVYRMQSDRGTTWPNGQRINESFRRHRGEVMKEYESAMRAGRITINEANDEYGHDIWRRVAPELGLRYERTKP